MSNLIINPYALQIPAVSITKTDFLQSNANQTAYTLTSANLGTYTPDRKIIIEAGGHGTTVSVRNISSITVDGAGNPAAVIQDGDTNSAVVNNGSGNRAVLAAWIIDAGVGTALEDVTSGNVVVTFSAAMLDGSIAVKAMTGAPSTTAHDVVVDSGSDPLTMATNVPANGAVGAAYHEFSGATCDWTNVTEVDESVGDAMFSTAIEAYATVQTGLSVEANISGISNGPKAVAYSFGP